MPVVVVKIHAKGASDEERLLTNHYHRQGVTPKHIDEQPLSEPIFIAQNHSG